MEMLRFQSECFQLKSGTPVFWDYFCFKAKQLKTFKTSSDVIEKHFSKRRAVLKIPSTIF